MTDKYIEALARVEFFADTLGLVPPSQVVSEDDAPAPELIQFCHETGMSLDWVFCGDLRPMVRATFEAKKARTSHA
ncbi:MAG: hypothetical protein AAF636_18205 [Pseudomonadota bacterium]